MKFLTRLDSHRKAVEGTTDFVLFRAEAKLYFSYILTFSFIVHAAIMSYCHRAIIWGE